jgi:urease accessory protein
MIAKLHIQTARRHAKTFLKGCYFTTPFKIADITEVKNDGPLQLMLMSSSPGILDGDEYHINIEVAEHCSLHLHTQSYQRLFTMKSSASQSMDIRLKKGASFTFLPHPVVPHIASDFSANNKIYLAAGCRLTWGEVLTCGRKLSGEEFLFSKYHSLTQIFRNERLCVKENLLITPATTNVQAIGQYESYSHQASLILIDEAMDIDATITEVNEFLSTTENICFGISALPVNGVIVRALGTKAEQLHACLKSIADLVALSIHKEVVHAS